MTHSKTILKTTLFVNDTLTLFSTAYDAMQVPEGLTPEGIQLGELIAIVH
jgi:hypothetical protein